MVRPSSVWCAPSTHSTAPMRSFTPTGWRRWRRRDKRAERAALDEVADIIAAAVRRFDAGAPGRPGPVRQDRGRVDRGGTSVSATRDRARRRADPHRIDVEPGRRAWLGVGRPTRAPDPAGANPLGRQTPRLRPALCAGVDASGATLDHDPHRAVSGRLRHRRGHLPGAAGLDHRHLAAAAQHIGGARAWNSGIPIDGHATV